MDILSHGYTYDKDAKKIAFHSCECARCKCRVNFSYNDLFFIGMEYYLNRVRAIFHLLCPECHAVIYSTYGEMEVMDRD